MNRIVAAVLKLNFKAIFYILKLKKCSDYKEMIKIIEKIFKKLNFELHVDGIENIPDEDGVVFFSNHISFFDPFFIALSCPKKLSFIGKKELENKPLIKDFGRISNSSYLDRDDTRQGLKLIIDCNKNIKDEKCNYCIFPEGTRNREKGVLEFKGGTFKLGTKVGSVIVPVAISGAKGSEFDNTKRIVNIRYLTPVRYEEYKDIKTIDLAKRFQNEIAKNIVE